MSTATSRIQNRYIVLNKNIATWNECRNRAAIFLDLGSSAIRCLEPIKVDLQENAEDVLFAMRMKLNALNAFDPIFRYQPDFQRERPGPIAPHTFVNMLLDFARDDPLPINLAEAYPVADNSVCKAAISTRQGNVRPLMFFYTASSHLECDHSPSHRYVHSTNRLCLAAITGK